VQCTAGDPKRVFSLKDMAAIQHDLHECRCKPSHRLTKATRTLTSCKGFLLQGRACRRRRDAVLSNFTHGVVIFMSLDKSVIIHCHTCVHMRIGIVCRGMSDAL
jgi:hypothetical protein